MDRYLNLAELHEICGEDNYGNMIWKRTPAGDYAAVPCPPDATGKPEAKDRYHPCTTLYNLPFISFELLGLMSGCLLTTGVILRRCTMDAIGLAYWESPTHVKCVSKEYQEIQNLVSLPTRFFQVIQFTHHYKILQIKRIIIHFVSFVSPVT